MRRPTALYLLPLLLASGRCDVVEGKRRSRSLSIPQRLAAGGASRFGAQLVTYPADAMRTLAQPHGQSDPLAVPQLVPAPRAPRGSGQLGSAQPLPRVLELFAFKAADVTAFGHSGSDTHGREDAGGARDGHAHLGLRHHLLLRLPRRRHPVLDLRHITAHGARGPRRVDRRCARARACLGSGLLPA